MRPAVSREVLARPFASVRAACATVAERARHVRIAPDVLSEYARQLPVSELGALDGPRLPVQRDPETLCAFVLALDAVNFGSGWFPELRKRPGHSGYRTIEAALIDHFDRAGAPGAEQLARATPEYCAELFGQDLDSPPIAELMGLFARAWRELGERVAGPFLPFVAGCDGSGAALVRKLLELPLYRDVARYDGLDVPLLKRAQLTVADLHTALPEAAGRFHDLDELTLFADNLVPHVLRLDGVLDVDPALVRRIESGERIEPGEAAEVELRAVAVHAVEQLSQRLGVPPIELDYWLWNRGAGREYKARPRHRCRCSFY